MGRIEQSSITTETMEVRGGDTETTETKGVNYLSPLARALRLLASVKAVPESGEFSLAKNSVFELQWGLRCPLGELPRPTLSLRSLLEGGGLAPSPPQLK